MYEQLLNTIDEYLSQPLQHPEGYKPSSNKLPSDKSIEPYRGDHQFSTLEAFVADLSIDFAMRSLAGQGPAIDRLRILSLQYHLAGEAKEMVRNHILSINRSKYDWTFKDVIFALYDWFVKPTSMHEAHENLKDIKYNPKKGVQTFYDDIMSCAQNMAVRPDEYSLVETLLTGLPTDIRNFLLFDRGLSPEIHTAYDFISHAMDFETR